MPIEGAEPTQAPDRTNAQLPKVQHKTWLRSQWEKVKQARDVVENEFGETHAISLWRAQQASKREGGNSRWFKTEGHGLSLPFLREFRIHHRRKDQVERGSILGIDYYKVDAEGNSRHIIKTNEITTTQETKDPFAEGQRQVFESFAAAAVEDTVERATNAVKGNDFLNGTVGASKYIRETMRPVVVQRELPSTDPNIKKTVYETVELDATSERQAKYDPQTGEFQFFQGEQYDRDDNGIARARKRTLVLTQKRDSVTGAITETLTELGKEDDPDANLLQEAEVRAGMRQAKTSGEKKTNDNKANNREARLHNQRKYEQLGKILRKEITGRSTEIVAFYSPPDELGVREGRIFIKATVGEGIETDNATTLGEIYALAREQGEGKSGIIVLQTAEPRVKSGKSALDANSVLLQRNPDNTEYSETTIHNEHIAQEVVQLDSESWAAYEKLPTEGARRLFLQQYLQDGEMTDDGRIRQVRVEKGATGGENLKLKLEDVDLRYKHHINLIQQKGVDALDELPAEALEDPVLLALALDSTLTLDSAKRRMEDINAQVQRDKRLPQNRDRSDYSIAMELFTRQFQLTDKTRVALEGSLGFSYRRKSGEILDYVDHMQISRKEQTFQNFAQAIMRQYSQLGDDYSDAQINKLIAEKLVDAVSSTSDAEELYNLFKEKDEQKGGREGFREKYPLLADKLDKIISESTVDSKELVSRVLYFVEGKGTPDEAERFIKAQKRVLSEEDIAAIRRSVNADPPTDKVVDAFTNGPIGIIQLITEYPRMSQQRREGLVNLLKSQLQQQTNPQGSQLAAAIVAALSGTSTLPVLPTSKAEGVRT